jgi:phosphoglycolate phosphatase
LKALIFDFDGTLATARYDFGAMREAVRALAGDYGVEARELEGLYVLEAVERAAEVIGAASERAAQFRALAERIILEVELRGAREAQLVCGAEQALAALRNAGYRIAIVTRNSRAATDLICGVRELACDAFLARDAVRRVKPHPEHLRAALGALACDPGQAVTVGDHPMDMTAARAAGTAAVGVLTGAGTRETLAAAGADLVLESVVELAQMLTPAPRKT